MWFTTDINAIFVSLIMREFVVVSVIVWRTHSDRRMQCLEIPKKRSKRPLAQVQNSDR